MMYYDVNLPIQLDFGNANSIVEERKFCEDQFWPPIVCPEGLKYSLKFFATSAGTSQFLVTTSK